MAAFNNDLVIRYLDTMAVKDDGCEVVFKAGMTVEVRIYSGCSYAGKLSSNRRYREARRVSAMTVRRACSALPITCTTMATSWDPRLVSALLLRSICHLII